MADDTVAFGDDDDLDALIASENTPKRTRKQQSALEAAKKDLGTEQDEVEAVKAGTTRARAAAAMALHGAPDWEIAEKLNYVTPAAARAAWEGVIADSYDPQVDTRALRRLRNAQLEGMMKSLAPRAMHEYVYVPDPDKPDKRKRVKNEEHLQYSQQMLRVVDRMIRLAGLDAPQVMTLVTPGVQDFEAVITALTDASRAGESEEGDIFELDEQEDGSFGVDDDK